jgi:hypothetical protein
MIKLSFDNNDNDDASDEEGRRFDSQRGQAYFSSLPGVDIHSE